MDGEMMSDKELSELGLAPEVLEVFRRMRADHRRVEFEIEQRLKVFAERVAMICDVFPLPKIAHVTRKPGRPRDPNKTLTLAEVEADTKAANERLLQELDAQLAAYLERAAGATAQ